VEEEAPPEEEKEAPTPIRKKQKGGE